MHFLLGTEENLSCLILMFKNCVWALLYHLIRTTDWVKGLYFREPSLLYNFQAWRPWIVQMVVNINEWITLSCSSILYHYHFPGMLLMINLRYLDLFLKHCCISINILKQHVMWSLVIQGMNWLKLFTTCISKGWSFVTLQGTVG